MTENTTDGSAGASTAAAPVDARERLVAVRAEVGKAVVGQDAAVSGLLVALLCGGHVLMEGVPGTAKTLLVRTLAGTLSVGTRRVQFTPDLMPGDITGSMVIDSKAGELTFREGPVFTAACPAAMSAGPATAVTPAALTSRGSKPAAWRRTISSSSSRLGIGSTTLRRNRSSCASRRG